MEVYECIKTRRSVRKFLDKEPSKELLNKIIDVVKYAPSSRNCQPWEIIRVRSQETKQALSKLKDEKNRGHILTAPVVLVVCIDTEKSTSRCLEDGAVAAQNILLMAHAMGLGGVYVTGGNVVKPDITKTIRSLLKIPKNIFPVAILPIGYPDPNEKLEEKKLRNIDKLIHEEKY